MPSIEELQKQIAKIKEENRRKEQRLRNIAEGKREMKQLGKKEKGLKKELRQLQSPKKAKLKKGIGRGLVKGGMVVGKFLANVGEAANESERQQRISRRAPVRRSQPKRRAPVRRSQPKRRAPVRRSQPKRRSPQKRRNKAWWEE